MRTLKINIPDNEFEELKEGLKKKNLPDSTLNVDVALVNVITQVKYYLKLFKEINFKEVYSGYNITENFPQLQVGEDGNAQFDIEEVFAGFDYDQNIMKNLIKISAVRISIL